MYKRQEDEFLIFLILTKSEELNLLGIVDGTDSFKDKAILLISVSFNLNNNSSAESIIKSESTDHALP
mgnify:FL=1